MLNRDKCHDARSETTIPLDGSAHKQTPIAAPGKGGKSLHKLNDHEEAKNKRKQKHLFPGCTFNLHSTYAFITNNNYFV